MRAEILGWLQPAQWVIGPLLGRNRAHTVLTVRLPSAFQASRVPGESAVQALVRLLRGLDWETATEAMTGQHQLTGGMTVAVGRTLKPSKAARRRSGEPSWWWQRLGPFTGFRVTQAYVVRTERGHERGIVKAWYLTGSLKWVDKVELTLLPTPGGNVVIEACSASTSCVPASVPMAPLWGLFLWWLPFDDLYTNYSHLRDVRWHLSARHGLHVEEAVLVRGGGCMVKTFQRDTLRALRR